MSILPPIGTVLDTGTPSSTPSAMSRILLPSADKFSLMDAKEQWLTSIFRQSGLDKVGPGDGAYNLGTYLFESTREYGIVSKIRLWHALPACLPDQRQQAAPTPSCLLLLEFFDEFPSHIFYLFSEELCKSKTDETFISELLYRKALQIRSPGNSSGVFNVIYEPNLCLNACDFRNPSVLKELKRLEFTVTEIQAKCAELTPTQNHLPQDPLVTILSPTLNECTPLLPKPPFLDDVDDKTFSSICSTNSLGEVEWDNGGHSHCDHNQHYYHHHHQNPHQEQYQSGEIMPLKNFISESFGMDYVSSSQINAPYSQNPITNTTTIHLNPFQSPSSSSSSLNNENPIILPQINFDYQPIQSSILSSLHLNNNSLHKDYQDHQQQEQQQRQQTQQKQQEHTHTVLDDLLSDGPDNCEATPFLSNIPSQTLVKREPLEPTVKSEMTSPTIHTVSFNPSVQVQGYKELKTPQVNVTTLVKVAPVVNPSQPPQAESTVCPVLNLKRARPTQLVPGGYVCGVPFKVGKTRPKPFINGPYQCQWGDCTRLFSTLPELTEHLQYVHIPNESSFTCLWRGCKRKGNPFMRYSCLMRHLRYHTGDKPCKCIFLGCGFSCVDNGDLRRHIKAVHQVDFITKKNLNT